MAVSAINPAAYIDGFYCRTNCGGSMESTSMDA